jgi:cardiolipin synthase
VAGTSDVMIAKHAERYMYGRLLKSGIELYEYQENVLHGKIAVCDEALVTIGSYNINNISAYASIELNLDIKHRIFDLNTKQILEHII